VELGEGGDPAVAVLHYLREEEGVGTEVNLNRADIDTSCDDV
jgi:hypothetical protein